MAVVELTEPSAAELQKNTYNSNVGGNLNLREQFTVPADTAWAVVGMVLVDAATPASIVSTLIPAVEALTEVTSVNGNQLYGQVPATIEDASLEAILYVTTTMSEPIGSGNDTFDRIVKSTERQAVPVAKKFVVMAMRLSAELDATAITTLETALEGITGVTTAEHLIDGYVSDRASAAATLSVAAHLRLDAIEV